MLNTGLSLIDLSHNDLSSGVYEFSVKLAKILTRHEQLMHLDLTETKLAREEIVFLGMSLHHSKSLIGIHLSMNDFHYYDRLFLRVLMNSKVAKEIKDIS